MAAYNLKIENGQLSFQPKRDYLGKILFFGLIAAVIFLVTPMLSLYYQTKWGVLTIGIVSAFTAIYDFIFHFNVTYVFDQSVGYVFRKIPGLYTYKLMSFDEMYIIHTQEDGLLYYALSTKQNKFGKSYAISQPFGSNRKSIKRRELFETEVLSVLESFTRTS
ncbi:hypothetical protein TH53_19405 [Pedobacter lusitanus]|uniref:Uncharacterized protein n=1 Tax=Pedobacter lusitanus TaxID=1503925 RepID=A0A0D0FT81_9SPHI|nr:hypothetical protein [Pedobacter lusitanus]KIO75654.1 hypothetical protein TH53_19405 [Pedobacter lusitanus]